MKKLETVLHATAYATFYCCNEHIYGWSCEQMIVIIYKVISWDLEIQNHMWISKDLSKTPEDNQVSENLNSFSRV